MALSALIVTLGLKAANQGWFKIEITLKLAALLLGPGLSGALAATQYMPIAVMIWSLPSSSSSLCSGYLRAAP